VKGQRKLFTKLDVKVGAFLSHVYICYTTKVILYSKKYYNTTSVTIMIL